MGHMEENESLTPLTILQVPPNSASPSFHDSNVTEFCHSKNQQPYWKLLFPCMISQSYKYSKIHITSQSQCNQWPTHRQTEQDTPLNFFKLW